MLVGNAIGEGMLLEPFLASAVIATQAIVELGSAQQREKWLPSMASGELIAVLAHDEAAAGIDTMDVQTKAVRDDEGWRLSGRKSVVYHAPTANLLLVTASVQDGGIGVFAVPSDAAGLHVQRCTTVDEQPAAALRLDDVHVRADARLGDEPARRCNPPIRSGLCAEPSAWIGAKATIRSLPVWCLARRSAASRHRSTACRMLMHRERSMSSGHLVCTDGPIRTPGARRCLQQRF